MEKDKHLKDQVIYITNSAYDELESLPRSSNSKEEMHQMEETPEIVE
ncbi:hypothetical protein [Bacillus sp. PS06]|nr:hypothetical protein [Bacillus sp. PS06]MBD8069097.1 hypothetical protein [Bacillus sp. PS06]